MTRLLVLIATMCAVLGVCVTADAATPHGSRQDFARIMRADDDDIAWLNHLVDTHNDTHPWRVWENAFAPLTQDDARIATRLLAYSWPKRVADDVHTIVTAKITEGAAYAAVVKACGDRNGHEFHLWWTRSNRSNLRSHRAENRVRAAFGLPA